MALSTSQLIQSPKLLETIYAIHDEFAARVAISMCEIVWGVVRDHDLVAKLKIAIFILACSLVIYTIWYTKPLNLLLLTLRFHKKCTTHALLQVLFSLLYAKVTMSINI